MSKVDRASLLFGLIWGTALIAMSTVLGALLPGYDPLGQTMSEIGESGSPFQRIFQVTLTVEAVCFLIFSYGVYRFASFRHVSPLPALALGFLGLMDLGQSFFATPHPLRNAFGVPKLLGFLAPLLLATSWPRAPDLSLVRRVSAGAAALVLVSIALSLVPLFVSFQWAQDHLPWMVTNFGLVQRTIFVFYAWCVFLAIVLFQQTGSLGRSGLTRAT
jgi:hypothetical membrane protein